MSFLQPWVLAALPLVALPILIHLINRNRHRSVQWGAMMFLVQASRMNKGMGRLRYVLVLLLRMAAVAAIIFTVSRPLMSGNLGGFNLGKPDATLILIDRSASMEARDLQSGDSKRSTALKKLSELLQKRHYGSQLVLIDSATGEAQLIESPQALQDLPLTEPTATSANILGMLETSVAYLKANEAGRADVWICSDLQAGDWGAESGRWTAVREQFAEMPGVQHFLLAYAEPAAGNLSIRVSNVRRHEVANQTELILDVLLSETTATTSTGSLPRLVPVEFEINGVRSTLEMEPTSGSASLLGHRIPINHQTPSGWGSVTLPGDTNPLDNRFYFVFSDPPVRRAVVVSDDPRMAETFRRCLEIPVESGAQHDVEVFPSDRVDEIEWESAGLVIWQAPLPVGVPADEIKQFVDSGRSVMFFPPGQTTDQIFLGTKWKEWRPIDAVEERKLTWWRSDADLLANVGSGEALPLNDLRTFRFCSVERIGQEQATTSLATLGNDQPLLTRLPTDRGSVYFCQTLPTIVYSSLEQDAVAFYVLLQRALTEGSRSLASATLRDADGLVAADLTDYEQLAPTDDAPTISERGFQPGVYRNGEDWIAVNRSLAEDSAEVVATAKVDQLFTGLAYQRIDDAVGNASSLAAEIWRAFLFLMALALIVEALLCLPEKKPKLNPTGGFASAES